MDFDMDFKSLLLSQISIFQLLLRIECTLFLHVDSSSVRIYFLNKDYNYKQKG